MSRLWLTLSLLLLCAAGSQAATSNPDIESGKHHRRWTVDDLFASPAPYALGHRGYGMNDGSDPSRPIENTPRAFRRAFKDGIRVVELDLQRTADGKIIVLHDDFLEDSTCIAVMTYEQVRCRRPWVPTFRKVLDQVKHFSRGRELSGIVFAEIKVPIPFCDGANTSAQSAASESRLVAAVVREIRRAKMEDQIILNSGSPTILRHVALQAPEIRRALTLNVLQLLPPQVVAQILHVPVVRIPKDDLGLAWYNVGTLARLPAMDSIPNFVRISLTVGSSAVSIDKQVLGQAGAAAPRVVAGFHRAGLETIVWTPDAPQEWDFVAAAGVDGITTNNIALGLARQAPLPGFVASGDQDDDDDLDDDSDRDEDDLDRDSDGDAIVAGSVEAVRIEVDRAYPNPFTSDMRFAYTVASAPEHVDIGVYDLAGRLQKRLVSGNETPGRHEVRWDGIGPTGSRVQPGVFFIRGSIGQRTVALRTLCVR